jgi:crotonobetainyl-CoA:carnitine CoA-transferase CaiB-like acyl-CoA transferase
MMQMKRYNIEWIVQGRANIQMSSTTQAESTRPAGAPGGAHAADPAEASAPELPLAGLTVVELGHSVAAPFAGMVLAELGANVLKIEAPGSGDDARRWGASLGEGTSATFESLNRDKMSAAVNLKDSRDAGRLRRFILKGADVVLQNMRPGLSRRFGIDAALVEEKPELIYCNIAAFGATGPLADRPGYDPLMQAFGGIMSITGEEGRPPVRVGPSIIDIATGMWAVIGILAALNRRTATGLGCVVDTSLYETALAWMTVPSALYLSSGDVPRRTGSEAAVAVPYKVYGACDGDLVIAAGNDNLFRRFADICGRPDWCTDPRYATNQARLENRAALNEEIERIVAADTRDNWLERLEAAGVPCAPLQNMREVLEHPQTSALAMLQQAGPGQLPLMGLPLSFLGRRPPLRRAPPRLGEHDDVLEQSDKGNDDGA